jgi:hypothetical protein
MFNSPKSYLTTSRRRIWLPSFRIDTDRGALLACLSFPILLAAVAFVVAVSLTAFGVPKIGTARSTVAAMSYLYLTLSVMWMPGYGVALAWYWWITRDHDRLLQRLYKLPLVEAIFVWFPSLVFIDASMGQRLRMYAVFALTAVALGYVWIGLVRLMFYFWRRK